MNVKEQYLKLQAEAKSVVKQPSRLKQLLRDLDDMEMNDPAVMQLRDPEFMELTAETLCSQD